MRPPHLVRNDFFDQNHREARSLPWLKEHTIFLGRHGSMAYGTNTPTSDVDIKGVAVAPLEFQVGFLHTFEQADKGFDTDTCIFEVVKFLKLAAECNPNIIELLFLDEGDILYEGIDFQIIRDRRQSFLSKQARWRFGRYAAAQLRRIETHRRWLLNPPKTEPTRRSFDLPDNTLLPRDQLAAAEDFVRKQIEAWDIDLGMVDPAVRMALEDRISKVLGEQITHDKYDLAGKALGFDTNMLEVMKRERQYRTARAEWDQFGEWSRKRNPVRHALEVEHGYDTKHGMHLVRLLRMAQEILSEGKVLVRRPDAAELLSIRHGAWSYDRLVSYAKTLDDSLDKLAQESKLPEGPDREKIDALARRTVMRFLDLDLRERL